MSIDWIRNSSGAEDDVVYRRIRHSAYSRNSTQDRHEGHDLRSEGLLHRSDNSSNESEHQPAAMDYSYMPRRSSPGSYSSTEFLDRTVRPVQRRATFGSRRRASSLYLPLSSTGKEFIGPQFSDRALVHARPRYRHHLTQNGTQDADRISWVRDRLPHHPSTSQSVNPYDPKTVPRPMGPPSDSSDSSLDGPEPNVRRAEMLRALRRKIPNPSRKAITMATESDTWSWILSTDQYLDWTRATTPEILVLSGGTDSSLQSLAHFLAGDLLQDYQVTSYLTHLDGAGRYENIVMWQLLLQLVEQDPDHRLNDLDITMGAETCLARAFEVIREKRVFCFLNLGSQLEPEAASQYQLGGVRAELMKIIKMSALPAGKVKLLLLCPLLGPVEEIVGESRACTSVDVEQATTSALEELLDMRMRQIVLKQHLTIAQTAELRAQVVDNAGGSFASAKGMLDVIEQSSTEDSLDSIIRSELYRTFTLNGRWKQLSDQARQLLGFVAVAKRPLTAMELQIIVERENTGSFDCHRALDILDQTFISRHDQGVQLANDSVRDFLFGNYQCPGLPKSAHTLHRTMARICTDYLLSVELSNDTENIRHSFNGTFTGSTALVRDYLVRWPFLSYAATQWVAHIQSAESASDLLNQCRVLCQPDEPIFWLWFSVYAGHNPLPLPPSLEYSRIRVACYLDLKVLVEHCLRLMTKDTIQSEKKALHLAATAGHREVLCLLLDHGMIPYLKDEEGNTALHLAAYAGHVSIVHELLQRRAPVDQINNKSETALHAAAASGKDGAISVLLTAQPNIWTRNVNGQTARQLAETHQGGKYQSGQRNLETGHAMAVHLLRAAEEANPRLRDSPILHSTKVDGLFKGIVARFDGSEFSQKVEVNVDQILSTEFLRAVNQDTGGRDFAWIHLPMNNMSWVEILLLQYERLHQTVKRSDLLPGDKWHSSRRATSRDSTAPLRPRWDDEGTQHAFLSSALCVPYVHWETTTEFLRMKHCIENALGYIAAGHRNSSSVQASDRYAVLANEYLNAAEHNPLHFRCTLDQYRYYSLRDITTRDNDQTLTRLHKRDPPLTDTPLLMVDQLWLWKLDDRCVLTCFPERWSIGTKGEPSERAITDVLNNVVRRLPTVDDIYDLRDLIIEDCVSALFNPKRPPAPELDVLECYQNEIRRIADRNAECFRGFALQVADMEQQQEKGLDPGSISIVEEVELQRQIQDVRDELGTLIVICRDQLSVLDGFPEGYTPRYVEQVKSCLSTAQQMCRDANDTDSMLNHLLDLKQKMNNLLESRSAKDEARAQRELAREAAKQSNTLMVFTAVTIVFLPLSFMASFFDLDIAEFPRRDGSLSLGFVATYICKLAFRSSRLSRSHLL
ncbi:hypothetical protein BDZ85DRAFT_270281, partial [Elsinoe ampelina]